MNKRLELPNIFEPTDYSAIWSEEWTNGISSESISISVSCILICCTKYKWITELIRYCYMAVSSAPCRSPDNYITFRWKITRTTNYLLPFITKSLLPQCIRITECCDWTRSEWWIFFDPVNTLIIICIIIVNPESHIPFENSIVRINYIRDHSPHCIQILIVFFLDSEVSLISPEISPAILVDVVSSYIIYKYMLVLEHLM